jgi:hypothetical protein
MLLLFINFFSLTVSDYSGKIIRLSSSIPPSKSLPFSELSSLLKDHFLISGFLGDLSLS